MPQPRILPPSPALALIAGLALAGCSVGDRQLVTSKQPVVAGDHAYVPNCPDWSDAKWNAREGNTANWGCATNSNLAAMIADPQDLVHGKSSPDVGAVAVRAVGSLGARSGSTAAAPAQAAAPAATTTTKGN